MLKIRKDNDHFHLDQDGMEETWWNLDDDEALKEDFSPDVERMLQEENELEVIIIPKAEYQYLLDCEDMLMRMQEMLGERIEEANNK